MLLSVISIFFPVGDGGSGNLQVLSFGSNLKCFFFLK